MDRVYDERSEFHVQPWVDQRSTTNGPWLDKLSKHSAPNSSSDKH